MTIVAMSTLTSEEVSLLGNNLTPDRRRSQRRRQRLAAVNRSLSAQGEQVNRLYGRDWTMAAPRNSAAR